LLFSSIINYTKKSLRPHGLGDFSVRRVFLQPLFLPLTKYNYLVNVVLIVTGTVYVIFLLLVTYTLAFAM